MTGVAIGASLVGDYPIRRTSAPIRFLAMTDHNLAPNTYMFGG